MPEYGALPHARLVGLRESNPDPAFQQAVAPAEHRAFAREYASEYPARAVGLVGAIPMYQVAKAAGLLGSRTGVTQPGAQMAAGFTGLGEGWALALRRALGM
jgi:hypothetical protein